MTSGGNNVIDFPQHLTQNLTVFCTNNAIILHPANANTQYTPGKLQLYTRHLLLHILCRKHSIGILGPGAGPCSIRHHH